MHRSMGPIPPLAREAIEYARRGDYDRALEVAKRALQQHPKDMGLQLFVGLLHSRRFEFELAVTHFRAAVAIAPNEVVPRLELARALVPLGWLEEAERLLTDLPTTSRDVQRLRAIVTASRGNVAVAAEELRRLVEIDASDFDSWRELGYCLQRLGDVRSAADAFSRSLELQPNQLQLLGKWAEAVVASGTGEESLEKLQNTAAAQPDRVGTSLAIARLHDLLGRPDSAADELRRALKLNPSSSAVLTALAQLEERRNEISAFAEDVKMLEKIAPDAEMLPLLKAKLAYRQKDMPGALRAAEATPPNLDPALRAQIIGDVRDRLGDSSGAWNAFTEMNREDSKAVVGAADQAFGYRERLAGLTAELSEEWAKRWLPRREPEESPVLLIGFPRSGTTLLDTFLMGNPHLRVSEENPLIPLAAKAAGQIESLPELGQAAIDEARRLYWAEAARHVPDRSSALLVDKFPFGLVGAAHIHRLFPDAPILFVERHPCDVVISCYFTRFAPIDAAAAFLDVIDTARLYDSMMRFWTRCTELLPLRVHSVQYERLIENPGEQLRAVAEFLDLDWHEEMIRNTATAERRGFIKTPSYAQVSEPVYSHSVGRWRRYREQMGEAINILAPWVDRLDYAL